VLLVVPLYQAVWQASSRSERCVLLVVVTRLLVSADKLHKTIPL